MKGLCVLFLAWTLIVHAARITVHDIAGEGELGAFNATEQAKDATGTKYCCCKTKACRPGAVGFDGTTSVYSRNSDLCCKIFEESCGYIFHDWGYKVVPPSYAYCEADKSPDGHAFAYSDPEADKVSERDVSELTEGTLEHTIHNYCDFKGKHSDDTEEDEETLEQQANSPASTSSAKRNQIVGALVDELSKNSLDSMAKEIFSIYMCVRWAPGPEFAKMARGEVATEQLPNRSVYELYSQSLFIPLRCSRNLNVYGDNGHPGHDTHFDKFEEHANALSSFFEEEAKGALVSRLQNTAGYTGDNLVSEARLFDEPLIRKLARCDAPETQTSSFKATADDLLNDCQSMKFFAARLGVWQDAMPFTSFMAPTGSAVAAAKLKPAEQVLICFGKRVASQLHRREGGHHLLTDQSAVGCHGFWNFAQTAKMLSRIILLWRPPTCQLAAMELDMKIKIMDLIADMNSRLFDALPAILMDEVDDKGDEDGTALKVGSTGNVISSFFSSIVSAFSGMRGSYTRLGLLLGNTVVKWAVCPLKKIDEADWEANDKLDSVLGTEDDIARYYAEQAYSKWTGIENALPGEKCEVVDNSPQKIAVPRCMECYMGFLQENTPEPYHDDKFICPTRPLLPPRQQLEVFKDKHDICLMHMTHGQWIKKNDWTYRGRRPHMKQYNSTTNDPTAQYEIIKITKLSSTVDKEFGLKHDFATYGRRCTEEELAATPDWCKAPIVANEADYLDKLASIGSGALGAVGGVAGAIGKGVELAGYKEETPPSNKASGKRFANWLYGAGHSMKRGIKSWWQESFGNSKTRYTRRYNRKFATVEAGELLHSASFQKKKDGPKADSKNYQIYNRYGVTCPCEGFNPDRELKLEFKWSESAFRIMGHHRTKALLDLPSFEVQLQSGKILKMSDSQNGWIDGFAFVRGAKHGADMPAWHKTDDAFLKFLTGINGRDTDKAISAAEMFGFSAHFSCGPRKFMHDLATGHALTGKEFTKPFSQCVKEGVQNNEALRANDPTGLYFPTETVVRVTYSSLTHCNHETITKDDNHAKFFPTKAPPPCKDPQKGCPPPKPERYWYESENDLHVAFKNAQSFQEPGACKGIDGVQQFLLDFKEKDPQYRGMITGKGLPKETLLEVLIDPADVKAEMGW